MIWPNFPINRFFIHMTISLLPPFVLIQIFGYPIISSRS
ncbi:MAG: hypothetical protein BSOLF_1500 [Candidatus Carbobacillus altaicus]|uniref:Uncharacterized protein n=1 Tax=Candidatus Carbonibacillus altaicus TaxID=2163959 RepID=A0A2R6XZ95_9BACL|nr:MAG: hypothetical protein BSOLF_1500 [Candidatus Carbobacillus altaicus]